MVPVPEQACTLAVRRPDTSLAPGRTARISTEGCSLTFEPGQAPDLAVGQRVDVAVTASGLSKPLNVPSVVHHRYEGTDGRLFDFRFLDATALRRALPEALFAVFDHRAAYRVQPDPSAPIEVTVKATPPGIRALAYLADLSVTGIAISVSAGLEQELRAVQRLDLSFRLPPTFQVMSMVGDIRHRRLASDGVRYGIAIDPERTRDFPGQQDLIRDYIRSRQQEIFESVLE
ncbi:MAG: hypothetical protein CMJ83_04590 [Planctomycetes bacterium]|nr:hypothetical protein [Planctomycetota bacterium]